VEGCGSYGSGLAKFLRRHDQKVHEVARPPRKGGTASIRQERHDRRRTCGSCRPVRGRHRNPEAC
jgi:hypothetical protein